ncbi:MAG: hypothetical protein L6R38_003132 [Xanthoria sp. 2 TBL-2021]|nr:MAG: hypothetical protein L6R38_003132 [Xanthoria sp. 2 TBL-2021]
MAYNAIDQRGNDTPSPRSNASYSPSPSVQGHHHESDRQLLTDHMDFELPMRPSMTRVSSSASTPLRHPTPDLQSLQGAYLSNIERLEQSAERLSMGGSDIGEELRKIRLEQKRSESRRSSLIDARSVDEASPAASRQFSYTHGSHASNSIAGINSIARSGGFSPEGYFPSPRGSIRSGSWSRRNSTKARSASNGSRFAQMLDSQDQMASPANIVNGFTPIHPPPEPPNKVLRVTNSNELPAIDTGEPLATQDFLRASPEPDLPRASSADTYQQAQAAGLFSDFDGVHATSQERPAVTPSPLDEIRPRQRSSRLASAGRPQSYLEPLPGENMVYYPAPVPMMLNLPQKLSKNPTAPQRDKRRSELLSGLDPDLRKSGVWLPGVVEGHDDGPAEETRPIQRTKDRRKTVGELPPQLRASLFFDYPSTQQDVEIKGGSAVETLDSILDASAFAPVSAFTDHPIVGRVGKEVYGRAPNDRRSSYMPLAEPENQKRRNSINLLKKRNSSSNLLENTQKRNSSLLSLGFGRRKSSAPQLEEELEDPGPLAGPMPSELTPLHNGNEVPESPEDVHDEFFDTQSEIDGERADEESELIGSYSGAPTTLLAELQLRKEQQKQRNRTAATAFPDGMHSTLLELDAVAQIQKQARTKKHTQLAWEDPNSQQPGTNDDDDEDVPLGILYPSRKPNLNGRRGGHDDNRPLGLIARRDMEDNEPLSHRRARLRGEPSIRRTPSPYRNNTMDALDQPGLQNNSRQQITPVDDDEDEGETLAQRIKRLKATKIPNNDKRNVSDDFASEIMSQFGGLDTQAKPTPTDPDNEPQEETLAQRRARLQAEKSRNVSGESNGMARPNVNKRRSMADLLQAHPAAGASSRVSSHNEKAPLPSSNAPKTPWTMQVQQRALSGEMPPPLHAINGNGQNHRVSSGGQHGVPNPLMFSANGPASNGLGDSGGVGEVRNRDMIDRWRQSVMY